MRRLTSKATYFYKRIFPLIWFGILSVVLCGGLLGALLGYGSEIMLVIVPICMAAFGYILMKKTPMGFD